MWIEFLGPPGVGKTTLQKQILCSYLANRFNLMGVPWPQRDVVAPDHFTIYRHMQSIYDRYCHNEGRREMRLRKFRILLDRVRRAELEQGIVVFDENMAMQAQAASYDFNHDWTLVSRVGELLPKPKLLIYCTAPDSEIVRRNIKRGEVGGHDRSRNALDVVKNSEKIAEMWRQSGTLVVNVDTSEPLLSQLHRIEGGFTCFE